MFGKKTASGMGIGPAVMCPGAFQLLPGASVKGRRLRRKRLLAPPGTIEAQSLALQRVGAQLRRVTTLRLSADSRERLGILRRITGQHIKAECCVAQTTGNRTHNVAVCG